MSKALLPVLEQIQDLADSFSGKKPMKLFPPASAAAIKEFLLKGWMKPLPPSYAELLEASDGIENFVGRVNFVGTDARRRKSLRSVIDELSDEEELMLEATYSEVSLKTIAKWDSNPDRAFLRNHIVVAAMHTGNVLLFDTRTVNSKGEMELCWIPRGSAIIHARYPSVRAYFEATLKELQGEAKKSKK